MISTKGTIIEEDGKKRLRLKNSGYFQQCINKLPLGDYEVRVEQPKRTRSLNQNNYFHGPVLDLVAETSGIVDKGKLKTWLKAEFGEKEVVSYDGKKHTVLKSTADYTKDEFTYFVNKIAEFFSLVLPDPKEYEFGRDNQM